MDVSAIKPPEGARPSAELTVLNLTHPDQYGLWFADGEGAIDTTYPGNHVIAYFVYDSSGNMTTVKRSIVVEIDPDAPVITLLGDVEVSHDLGSEFNDRVLRLRMHQVLSFLLILWCLRSPEMVSR